MEYETIYSKFKQTAEKYPKNEALAVIENSRYKAMSYAELSHKTKQLSAGFSGAGLSKGDKIAFMANNGPNWVMIDLASAALGIINAPIHTTYKAQYIRYIAERTSSRWLIIDQKFWNLFKDDLKDLKVERVVVIGHEGDFGSLFIDNDFSETIANQDDVHTIIHTSGTTGMPKGVMLTHKNILSNVFGAKNSVFMDSSDRFLSFMPLSHALERTAGYYVPILSGAAIYYAQSKDTMKHDIIKAKPTILISVPRVFEKVYDAVWDKATHGSALKKWMFYKALDFGSKRRKRQLRGLDFAIYCALDILVLKKIRAGLGGCLRFAISGGSALSADIMQFFEDIGLLIIEGYGLTETSPIVAVNKADNYKFGAVGLPLAGVEVKIAYDGEVKVRGDIVMKGYYDDPSATQEAIDSQGWFSTGDLGLIDSDGFLKITGRKKEIIVLSTGKNSAPVPIEQELEANRFISQAFVYGDNQKHISALIVPDFDELKRWSEKYGIAYDMPDMLLRDDARQLFEKEIKSQLNHFPEYEQVRDFRLIAEEFTQENDLLTPTLKLKRKKILERYLTSIY